MTEGESPAAIRATSSPGHRDANYARYLTTFTGFNSLRPVASRAMEKDLSAFLRAVSAREVLLAGFFVGLGADFLGRV